MNGNHTTAIRAVETQTIRVLLAERNWTVREFARRLGISRTHCSVMMSKDFPIPLLRAKVEAIFSYLPLWSPAREVKLRRQCVQQFGFDPAFSGRLELIDLAKRRFGIQLSVETSWSNAIEKIFEYLAAHPRGADSLQRKPPVNPI